MAGPLVNIPKYTVYNRQSQLFPQDLAINAQQKFRFIAVIDNIPAFYISRIERPSYTIQTQEHVLLDHVVRYPVKVKWEQISFTIREIFGGETVGSVGANVMNKLLAHSYYYPDEVNSDDGSAVLDLLGGDALGATRDRIFGVRNLTKENLTRALGNLKILSLRPDGSIFESWTIYNGMITSVKFSDNSYSEDGLTDISVTVQYDWAKLELGASPFTVIGDALPQF